MDQNPEEAARQARLRTLDPDVLRTLGCADVWTPYHGNTYPYQSAPPPERPAGEMVFPNWATTTTG